MDELHAWPKRELWEALKTGLIKTAGSLNVIITTAGRGQTSIAHEQRSSSGSTLRKSAAWIRLWPQLLCRLLFDLCSGLR
jgi:phage terminase large subunit-like protein